MKRKQFTFYRSFYEAMMLLPQRLRIEFLQAIIEYALNDVEPEFKNYQVESLFVLVKPVLETAQKRAKSGSLGGAVSVDSEGQKGSSKTQAKRKQNGSKTQAKRKQIASEGEGEKEEEIETETEVETEVEIETETEGDGWVCVFQKFWDLYPKKIGKQEAMKAWEECVSEPEKVLDALRAWKSCKVWSLEGGRFIPHPEKWLRQRYFEETPKGVVYWGATGELGEAEVEAIRKMFASDESGGNQ